jgi:hypothetical protein
VQQHVPAVDHELAEAPELDRGDGQAAPKHVNNLRMARGRHQ